MRGDSYIKVGVTLGSDGFASVFICTYEDFPLPVGPMMAFMPGMKTPLQKIIKM